MLMHELVRSMLSPEEAENITKEQLEKQFPDVSYYKDQDTGVRKLGLCRKQVRKMIKMNPYVTVEDFKKANNLA